MEAIHLEIQSPMAGEWAAHNHRLLINNLLYQPRNQELIKVLLLLILENLCRQKHLV